MISCAADMGTGCDTILAQMVAECMDCDVDEVAVFGADTDASPYDSGSYASSTTYITGMAVEKACENLKKRICEIAGDMFKCEPEEILFVDDSKRNVDAAAALGFHTLYFPQDGNLRAAVEAALEECNR